MTSSSSSASRARDSRAAPASPQSAQYAEAGVNAERAKQAAGGCCGDVELGFRRRVVRVGTIMLAGLLAAVASGQAGAQSRWVEERGYYEGLPTRVIMRLVRSRGLMPV